MEREQVGTEAGTLCSPQSLTCRGASGALGEGRPVAPVQREELEAPAGLCGQNKSPDGRGSEGTTGKSTSNWLEAIFQNRIMTRQKPWPAFTWLPDSPRPIRLNQKAI